MESRERYGLAWAGKSDATRSISSPCAGTLLPLPAESSAFGQTGNLLIEGDNLEVLKLLQKGYQGQIKLIYIDPPYNSGKDFVYPDDYREGLKAYLRFSGQVSEQGARLTTNPETDGRYHSRWLSMIYPRLALARQLLRDDGAIFISIDDSEVHHLRLIMNELFGEENFVACVANVNNPKGRSDDRYIARAHEYLLIYKRGVLTLRGWEPDEQVLRRYRLTDSATGKPYRELDLRKTGSNDRRQDRERLFYFFLYNAATGHFYPTREEAVPPGYIQIRPLRDDGTEGNWRWELTTAAERIARLVPKQMPRRRVWSVFEKDFLEADETVKPTSAWTRKEFNSERGSEQLVSLGFAKEIFPYPKPLGLLKRILQMATDPGAGEIVLDFFAGSCTTAHAVLEQNREDGGNRRFICVQLPEPTPAESAARKAGFATVAAIGKARIERATARLAAAAAPAAGEDLGFRYFRLADSGFKAWDGAPEGDLAQRLLWYADNVVAGRQQEELLFEVLLNDGYPLTLPCQVIPVAGQRAFLVDNGALLVCLEGTITPEALIAMKEQHPKRMICLDSAFHGRDSLKTNTLLELQAAGVQFQTV